MSTAAVIIANGYSKSAAARVDTIAVTPELVARINQCLLEVFQVLARENPYLIGARLAVAFDGTGWPRPVDALRVIKVVADAGTVSVPALGPGADVNVVPFDDQFFCEGLPSLTELGQAFIPVGQTMDPTAGTVTMIYARAPLALVVDTDLIDPLYPAPFNDYQQCDIAAYLATKDQRSEDEATFIAAKNALMGQIIDWARTQTFSVQQRFVQVSPPLASANAGRAQPEKG